MKKMFKALLIFCITFCSVFYVNCASACSQKTTEGQITGGACSVKELNKLENSRMMKSRTGGQFSGERNLRPVKPSSEKINTTDDCIFGMCLYRDVLEGATKGE